MKLSAYYKRKGEVVILSPLFSPERHQKFILRKDYNDGIFPKYLLTTPNLEYGGLAFSNNNYHPLDYEIEVMKPDTTIYTNMQNRYMNAKGTAKLKKKIFQN